MVVFGVVTPQSAFHAIDLPTILLLYSLMIISAQFRLGGFYTWTARKIIPYAGNLILLGSIANLIVVEQAAVHGIRISFLRHAKVGVIVTGVSLAVLFAWI